jgi:NLR family CARD domain-containing protein 3
MATLPETDPSLASPPARRRYIPDDVEYLSLRREDIDAEEAKLLAEELASNTTLKELDLRGNTRIGDDGAVALVGALATNKALKNLSLYHNGIGDAGMEALGQALMQNDSLETLVVDRNIFGIAGLTSLATGLKVNKGLKELWVRYLAIDKVGAAVIAVALMSNTSLTKLHMNRNSIGDGGAVALGEALKVNTSLTRLGLERNSIGDGGAVALGAALEVNISLTTLHLWNNSIGDEGASSLLDVLKKCNTTLTELTLHGNDNISEATNSVIAAFIDANEAGIRPLHCRADLDLSSKNINDRRAKQIAMELADNTTVTTLILNKNEIGSQGCVDIANALIKNRVLTSIELNDNSIGDVGCTAMAATLRENTVLTKISLIGNGIGPAGAIALAQTLQTNASLRDLGLGRNNIGNEGTVAIAETLRCNETLERLDLDANNTVILKALTESNCSLMWLNLRGSFILSGLRKAIDFVLASRRVLKSFCKCLCKPLDKKLMPLVVHGVQLTSISHKKTHLVHSRETAAGPIFLLVRAAALNDSKFSRSRTP